MVQQSSAYRAVDQPDGWLILANEQHVVSSTVASSPYSAIGFFVGWMALGVYLANRLIRRGHDRRTLMALGAGLGPLMLVARASWQARESTIGPDVVATGTSRNGGAHVLVVVSDGGADVGTLRPTLDAIRPDLATLTVGRTVAFEWLDGTDNDELDAARADIRDALERLDMPEARGEVRPGTTEKMVADFRGAHPDGVVLFAVDEVRVDRSTPRAT